MPRGPFWYLFVALTQRGRAVALSLAVVVELILIALDYKIPDVEFAMFSIGPILVCALTVNYRFAVISAVPIAVIVSLLETFPPQTLTNPNVWWNALIFWFGYLTALGLMYGVSSLAVRLRSFLADFSELKAAHDDLLPEQLPWLGDWEFSALHVPQHDVGGVFYDVAPWKGGIDLFACGVSGPPIRAAMLLPALKGLWLRSGALPPASLRVLNRRLAPLLKRDALVRAWYGKLYNNGIVRYASAGFPAPFLVSSDGSVRRLAGGGTSLGGCSAEDVAEAMYMLDCGATLILGNEGFCRLVEDGALEPEELLLDLDELRAQLRALPRDGDILAVVARRKTNFLFSHHFEEPVLGAEDPGRAPDRLLQPRDLPKLEP
ncbi:MAG TPA: SpoIIE family protein phosphatase [Candidatus Binatia bacterium]|nr:SpoIIE family protein phosphatase [Candidatus Binatia bacterium]